MRVSVGLHTLSEEQMQFIKQIGVDYVDLEISIVPKYHVKGRLGPLTNFAKVFKKIRGAGLHISYFRTCAHDFSIRNFLLGRPGGERELDEQCALLRFLGEESIPVAHIALGSDEGGVRGGPMLVPGRYQQAHRGGYTMAAFDLTRMRQHLAARDLKAPWARHFTDTLTFDDYWSRIVQAYERLIPVAEASNVKLVIHPDDPPVPDGEDLLPGFENLVKINRLFDAVPSMHNGIIFCCGTRYESGVDIYHQIRLLGRQNKIFHVHFRNVRGTLPSTGGYDEAMLDEGDMDMFRVLQALDRVHYEGCLRTGKAPHGHQPILAADPTGNAALAWSVGYVKALLSALPSNQQSF